MRAAVQKSLAFLLPLLTVECGPGVGEGFPEPDATGTGDTDSDTTTDFDGYEECPAEIEPDCEETSGLKTQLETDDIGFDVHFANMGRNALVATRTVGEIFSPLVIRMDFDEFDGADSIGLAEIPEPPVISMIPIAIAGDLDDGFGAWALALVKHLDGHRLLGTNVEYRAIGELIPVVGGEVPATSELRGLVYLQQKVPQLDPQFELVCAYGDGLFCYDGATWDTAIEPGTGRLINDIGVLEADGERRLLVVGDGGWIAYREQSGWQELATQTEADLLAVSVDNDTFLAAGRHGIFVYGTDTECVTCDLGDETVVALSGIPGEGSLGVFESGPVFFWELGPTGPVVCMTGNEVPGALATRIVGCDASLNLFVLTEDTLLSNDECGVLSAR